MSTPPIGTETLGSFSDEPVIEEPSGKNKAISGKSPMRIALGRLARDKIAVACAFIVLLFVLIAVFAGTLCDVFGVTKEAPLASANIDFATGLPKTGPPNHGFDSDHPFGLSPRAGEDNLANWLYGCRTSLTIAGLATLFASLAGLVIGLIAGFVGGVVDRVLSFVIDFFLSLPYLLLALSIAPILNERFIFKPQETFDRIQLWSIVGILAFLGWMGTARLIRGEVITLREREFVQAARVLGMPTWRIMLKELLPNLAAPIVISISLMLPAFVAAEAGLAFLGIGVSGENAVSWGQTILKATPYFEHYWLYLWEPLLGIVILVIALNLLGDAIRDALDPKTRR